jgi:hypothetical protein
MTDRRIRATARPDAAIWYRRQADEAQAQREAVELHATVERLLTALRGAELADIDREVGDLTAASMLFQLAATEADWRPARSVAAGGASHDRRGDGFT